MAVAFQQPTATVKAMAGQEVLLRHQPPRLLILFDFGHEEVVRLIADVLGYDCLFVDSLEGAKGSLGMLEIDASAAAVVVGIEKGKVRDLEGLKRAGWMVVMTGCGDARASRNGELTQVYDYEVLHIGGNKIARGDLAHPTLHASTAPDQMSVAKINSTLNSCVESPARDLFIVTDANGPSHFDSFFQKLLNEVSLPHAVHSAHTSQLAQVLAYPTFGGCSIEPAAVAAAASPKLPPLTRAAAAIGLVDTITALSTSNTTQGRVLVADNLTWRAIQATLTQDFTPAAYADRTAVVLANEESAAAAAMYALGRLGVRMVCTIGFEARKGCTGENVVTRRIEDLNGLRRMRMEESPFVVVNALPAGRGKPAVMVLQLFAEASSSVHGQVEQRATRVFLDLTAAPVVAGGAYKTGEPCEVAGHLGWKVYDGTEVKCRFVAATFQELCGHRVPVEFVRRFGGLGAGY